MKETIEINSFVNVVDKTIDLEEFLLTKFQGELVEIEHYAHSGYGYYVTVGTPNVLVDCGWFWNTFWPTYEKESHFVFEILNHYTI